VVCLFFLLFFIFLLTSGRSMGWPARMISRIRGAGQAAAPRAACVARAAVRRAAAVSPEPLAGRRLVIAAWRVLPQCKPPSARCPSRTRARIRSSPHRGVRSPRRHRPAAPVASRMQQPFPILLDLPATPTSSKAGV
jgi:hypothetical protein